MFYQVFVYFVYGCCILFCIVLVFVGFFLYVLYLCCVLLRVPTGMMYVLICFGFVGICSCVSSVRLLFRICLIYFTFVCLYLSVFILNLFVPF